MSKSYNNTITLREDADSVTRKIRTMPTDPRVSGAPTQGIPRSARCGSSTSYIPNNKTRERVQKGCKSAGIGCLSASNR
jgi:tryptophanyl-tRNA synthetase